MIECFHRMLPVATHDMRQVEKPDVEMFAEFSDLVVEEAPDVVLLQQFVFLLTLPPRWGHIAKEHFLGHPFRQLDGVL